MEIRDIDMRLPLRFGLRSVLDSVFVFVSVSMFIFCIGGVRVMTICESCCMWDETSINAVSPSLRK